MADNVLYRKIDEVADVVADNGMAEAELTTTKEPEKAGQGGRKEHGEERYGGSKAGTEGRIAVTGRSPRSAGGEVVCGLCERKTGQLLDDAGKIIIC